MSHAGSLRVGGRERDWSAARRVMRSHCDTRQSSTPAAGNSGPAADAQRHHEETQGRVRRGVLPRGRSVRGSLSHCVCCLFRAWLAAIARVLLVCLRSALVCGRPACCQGGCLICAKQPMLLLQTVSKLDGRFMDHAQARGTATVNRSNGSNRPSQPCSNGTGMRRATPTGQKRRSTEAQEGGERRRGARRQQTERTGDCALARDRSLPRVAVALSPCPFAHRRIRPSPQRGAAAATAAVHRMDRTRDQLARQRKGAAMETLSITLMHSAAVSSMRVSCGGAGSLRPCVPRTEHFAASTRIRMGMRSRPCMLTLLRSVLWLLPLSPLAIAIASNASVCTEEDAWV